MLPLYRHRKRVRTEDSCAPELLALPAPNSVAAAVWQLLCLTLMLLPPLLHRGTSKAAALSIVLDNCCRVVGLQHVLAALLQVLRDGYLRPPTFEVLGTLLLLYRCQIQAFPTGVVSATTVSIRT